MSQPAVAGPRATLRVTPSTLGVLSAAALAWLAVVLIAREMGNGVGTMDTAFPAFVGMWAVMMTAMMLPAVAPVASLYARTIPARQPRRWLLFAAGYFLTWTAVGVPAYLLLRVVDGSIDTDGTLRALAAVVLALAGIYQLTPLKAVCLRHCRSPLAQLLHYGNVKGRTRDLRVAVHHAAFCVGCCWMLMVLLLAFGVMNLWVMAALAAVIVGEKLLPRGEALGRLAGVAFVAVAVAVALSPDVAEALLPSVTGEMSQM